MACGGEIMNGPSIAAVTAGVLFVVIVTTVDIGQ
jgi:hypothetical protein